MRWQLFLLKRIEKKTPFYVFCLFCLVLRSFISSADALRCPLHVRRALSAPFIAVIYTHDFRLCCFFSMNNKKKNLFWEEAAHRKETLSGWSSNRDRARLFWQARWDHPPHVNRVEYANLKLASRLYQKETKEAKTINYSRPPPTIFVCVCVNRQSLLQHRMLHELFMNISIGKDKWALTILKEEKSPVIVPLKK